MVSTTRRTVLKGAGLLAAAAAVGSKSALASDDDHAHHHHGENPNQKVVDAALDCINKGQACLDHCFVLLKQGDTEMGDCAASVDEMLAMCASLAKLASARSTHLPALAKVCIDVCQDCEDICREHEDKHAECKACAESCEDCIEACEAIV